MISDLENGSTVIGAIRFARPLVSTGTALSVIQRLDYEEQVLALVESGDLLWAWDVAAPNANRREIRILGQSINAYLAGNPGPDIPPEGVMRLLFPEGHPTLSASELARRMNLCSTHMLTLCRSGCLRLVPGARVRRGPSGSPQVELSSVAKFLEQRRIL